MKPIFAFCVLCTCSSMFTNISSASMPLDDETAVKLPATSSNGSPSLLSGFSETRFPSPIPSESIPSTAAAATTADSFLANTSSRRNCGDLLSKVVSDPTLLSDVLPAPVVRALVRFVQVLDPSLHERVPPRMLTPQLDNVPPPGIGDRCGPWRHDFSGYFVRDCFSAAATLPAPSSTAETIAEPAGPRDRPQSPAWKFNPIVGARVPYSRRPLLVTTRPAKTPKSLFVPSWNRPPVVVRPAKNSKRMFRLVARP